MFFTSALAIASLASLGIAQSSFSPRRPPAIPLAVRSPYMSTWQQAGSDGGNGGYLTGEWPTFWGGAITGWTGMIRVDNATYTWMGKPDNHPVYTNQTAFEYTSTRSTFTMDVQGQVKMTIEFLSPVTPNDLERSSLPYTYLSVAVESIDGKQHSVQLYTDVSAEWAAGDRGATVQWDYSGSSATIRRSSTVPEPILRVQPREDDFSSTSVVYHRFYRQQQLEFSEVNDQAEWGYWYYATQSARGLTYQTGPDITVRQNFLNSGALPNSQDTNYRPINDNWPVFAYSIDLGQVGTTSQTALFQLSLHQDNCVQFEDKKNIVSKIPCLWKSYFSSDSAAVSHFYNDFAAGSSLATSFDNQVASDSIAAGGQDYPSLTSLAARQAFGAIEYTNTPTTPYVFMKEISSDGNVNTVDVIFPFHPIALYTNPSILKWVLDPLFINQEAGNWPKQYSIHDIGSAFPNATGHNDGNAEDMPLEECGNMLVMTLAYAQRTNDVSYLKQHYNLLKQWTTFLVQEALIPANQISTDDFAGPASNQTNLALKGIIGIEAMAQIANLTGNSADGQNYSAIAHDYINKWQGYAVDNTASPPHTTFNYNNDSSYSLLYNLYADKELGLNLVPESVYTMQSNFYPTVFQQYGVPLDTRHTYTKMDWEIWCAAIASDSTKQKFVSTLAQWLDKTPTNQPFTDLYDTISGGYPSDGPRFVARPVIGGVYGFLALNSAP